MLSKLQAAENRYEELTQKLMDPEILGNTELYRQVVTEHSELEELVTVYREYKTNEDNLVQTRALLEETLEADFRELAQSEFEELKEKKAEYTQRLKLLLTPKDPNDDKNVYVEIRGGAGGEEAALFGAVLFRMYSKYAEKRGWHLEVVDENETEIGGLKEIVFMIQGRGAYSRLKFESGVHRVQRVPSTESQGRIHTSTATVAVLPETPSVEVSLNMNDLQIDTYRSGGAGGQHINKTDSAIRITHKPTGIVVTCQNQRSQLKNKEQALSMLKVKLFDIQQAEQNKSLSADRKSQIGTGDRSERIRTYNYPQNRVTDHRIDLTLYKLGEFLEGNLDEMVDALITVDQSEKLAAGGGTGDFT